MGAQVKKLDILLVTDNGLETVGGEQESTKIIINGVKDIYSVGVIQPGEINKNVDNVKCFSMTRINRVKHLIKNPFAFLIYIWKIRSIINKYKPRVIHTQSQVSFLIVSLLKKLRLISPNNKFIHTERGLYINYSEFFKTLFKIFMSQLDVLVTTTNFNQKYWINALQDKKYDIEYKVIENTAGEIFEQYNPSKKIKKEKGKIVVGFAGRYSKQKNWPLAVEICEKLNDKLGDNLYVYMAVGCLDNRSKQKTTEMFNYLNNILGDRFKGVINIDLEQMDSFYYNIDYYILTSLPNSESFGRTIIEAMSRKVCVLSTNAGGPVEIISNNSNICESSEEFIHRIIYLNNHYKVLENIVNDNFKRVHQIYSLQNNIIKHNKLYQKLL